MSGKSEEANAESKPRRENKQLQVYVLLLAHFDEWVPGHQLTAVGGSEGIRRTREWRDSFKKYSSRLQIDVEYVDKNWSYRLRDATAEECKTEKVRSRMLELAAARD